jgi:hypothetical protein
MRLEKYFLQQILRVLDRANHPHHQAEKTSGVLAVQLLERAGVTGPAPRGQFQIGGSHVSLPLRRRRGSLALPVMRMEATKRNTSCLAGLLREESAWQRSAGRQPNRK